MLLRVLYLVKDRKPTVSISMMLLVMRPLRLNKTSLISVVGSLAWIISVCSLDVINLKVGLSDHAVLGMIKALVLVAMAVLNVTNVYGSSTVTGKGRWCTVK